MWQRIRLAAGVMVVLFCFGPQLGLSQSDLPANVQADLLKNRIVAAVKHNDYRGVLAAISEYKQLRVEFPTPLLFVEAQAAYATGDFIRSLSALVAYLNAASKQDRQYQDAIAFYPKVHRAALSASRNADLGSIPANIQNEVCHIERRCYHGGDYPGSEQVKGFCPSGDTEIKLIRVCPES